MLENTEKSFVHLITMPTGKYVYDVNRDVVLKVQEEVYQYLLAEQQNNKDAIKEMGDLVPNLVGGLKAEGLLSSKRPVRLEHSLAKNLEDYLENCVEKLTLQVTRQCNLRCKYCIYSEVDNEKQRSHSNEVMAWDTVKEGIDFLLSHSRGVPNINLSFYGGEPFLNFDLIKKSLEYIEVKGEGKEITYNLTTNGTIMNDEIVALIEKYSVSVTISLDGPGEVHNKNRVFADGTKGTYQKIEQNLFWLRDNHPEFLKRLSFNAVMDPENDFSCINEFFMNYWVFEKTTSVMASIVDKEYSSDEVVVFSKDFFPKSQYETFRLYLALCGRIPENEVSIISRRAYDQFSAKFENRHRDEFPEVAAPGGPCVPGARRLFMDVRGNFYPCERVSETSACMRIGSLKEGFDLERCKALLNVSQLTEAACKNCFAFQHCTQCARTADENGVLNGAKRLKGCNDVRNGFDSELRDYIMLLELQNMVVGR